MAQICKALVLFSKNNKFQLSNAKRTVKAYEAVKNVKPVYGNYRVIEKINRIRTYGHNTFCNGHVKLALIFK